MKGKAEAFHAYLAPTAVIDWQHGAVLSRAQKLAAGSKDPLRIAERSFEWVRDQIAHSMDIGETGVTCRASEVLQAGHGLCFAKSHLLAALLRANGIPAGFDYQRLQDDEGGYCLHGFNSLWLPEVGWYRVDARGNRAGIDARFEPPWEYLAYRADGKGEIDYGINSSWPLPEVVRVLQSQASVDEVLAKLPASVRMG